MGGGVDVGFVQCRAGGMGGVKSWVCPLRAVCFVSPDRR